MKNEKQQRVDREAKQAGELQSSNIISQDEESTDEPPQNKYEVKNQIFNTGSDANDDGNIKQVHNFHSTTSSITTIPIQTHNGVRRSSIGRSHRKSIGVSASNKRSKIQGDMGRIFRRQNWKTSTRAVGPS